MKSTEDDLFRYRVMINNNYVEVLARDIFHARTLISTDVLRHNFELYIQGRWIEIEL